MTQYRELKIVIITENYTSLNSVCFVCRLISLYHPEDNSCSLAMLRLERVGGAWRVMHDSDTYVIRRPRIKACG